MESQTVAEVVDARDPEEMSDFGRVTVLLMKSYEGGKGRTFDPKQVAALAEGLMDMAGTINGGMAYTEQLEAELAEIKDKEKKLWRPKK